VGGKKYFNTTPLGRAVTTTAIVRAMREDDVHVFGDGSTHKGNDIQRFYRYGIFTDPTLKIYKPWLDPKFVAELGGRTEMSEYLASSTVSRTAWAQRRPTAPTPTCSAPRTRRRTSSCSSTSMKIVKPIMGVAPWNKDVGRDRARDRLGRPSRAACPSRSTASASPRRSSSSSSATASADARASA
jgi:argininosuccinate synthase